MDREALNRNGGGSLFRKLFGIGETSAKRAVSSLFYVGLAIVSYRSIVFGRHLYLAYTYQKKLQIFRDGVYTVTYRTVNHLPLGILGGIVFFVLSVVAWKILCELVYIIVRAFETYALSNGRED